MQASEPVTRGKRCSSFWYPARKQQGIFRDNPTSSAVISPHAGFIYSGKISLEAVSRVRKERIWIMGPSHFSPLKNGISVFYGDYSSSAGSTRFPVIRDREKFMILSEYFSDEAHFSDEHSIENIVYCLNHYAPAPFAICVYVGELSEKEFACISSELLKVWEEGDSIIISSDWNHFVTKDVIDRLMGKASALLESGNIEKLFSVCKSGKLEACGINALYLAHKILSKAGEKTKFNVLISTDSSKTGDNDSYQQKCVGYIAACN